MLWANKPEADARLVPFRSTSQVHAIRTKSMAHCNVIYRVPHRCFSNDYYSGGKVHYWGKKRKNWTLRVRPRPRVKLPPFKLRRKNRKNGLDWKISRCCRLPSLAPTIPGRLCGRGWYLCQWPLLISRQQEWFRLARGVGRARGCLLRGLRWRQSPTTRYSCMIAFMYSCIGAVYLTLAWLFRPMVYTECAQKIR